MKILHWKSRLHAPLLHQSISGKIINSYLPKPYKTDYFIIDNEIKVNNEGPPEDIFIAETGRVVISNRINFKKNNEFLVPSLSPDFSPSPKGIPLDFEKVDKYYGDISEKKIELIVYFYLTYLGRLPEKDVVLKFIQKSKFNKETIYDLRKNIISSSEYINYLKKATYIPGIDLRYLISEKGVLNRVVKLFIEKYK